MATGSGHGGHSEQWVQDVQSPQCEYVLGACDVRTEVPRAGKEAKDRETKEKPDLRAAGQDEETRLLLPAPELLSPKETHLLELCTSF